MWTKTVLICTHAGQDIVIDGIPLAEMKSVLGVQDHENVTDDLDASLLNQGGRQKLGQLQEIIGKSTMKLMRKRLSEGSIADDCNQGDLHSCKFRVYT